MSFLSLARVFTASVLAITFVAYGADARGAATTSPSTAPSSQGQPNAAANGNEQEMAPCPACGMKLVAVTDQTPRSVYQGKTYYFANSRCKDAFDKNPTKYAAKVAAWEKSHTAAKSTTRPSNGD